MSYDKIDQEYQQALFDQALSVLPEAVAGLRVNFMVLMVFNALARYAARVERDGLVEAQHADMRQELVTAATAVLGAQGQA